LKANYSGVSGQLAIRIIGVEMIKLVKEKVAKKLELNKSNLLYKNGF
jgi:hypothetical protein